MYVRAIGQAILSCMRAALSVIGYGERVMKQKGKHMKPFRQIMMGVVILIIAGCTTQFRNQGYIPTEEEIGALVVGVDTRDSVFEVLGTPTTYGVLQEDQAYYVRSVRTHRRACPQRG